MEGVAVKFHQFSELRQQPFCQHFGVCGGCKWQNLIYEEQIKAKRQQVIDNLTRIGKIDLPDVCPVLGSEKTREYRNKLEFGFSNKRWLTEEEIQSGIQFDSMDALGFHITGAFDKILDIQECHLMDNINNLIRNGNQFLSVGISCQIKSWSNMHQTGINMTEHTVGYMKRI